MSSKIRVLIVDDLPETRENVRKLLQFETDMEVIGQAASGREAIEITRQHKPDVILMDINMPDMDGIAASQVISRSSPASQIIIMSVQSDADYLRKAMLAGARDFLMKPFSGDELVTAVRRVYESRPIIAAAPPPPTGDSGATTAVRRAAGQRRGKVIVVYSPKGGVGCTTVAINLSVSLAQKRRQTILIDSSFQFGDVSVMMNLKPSTTIMDLVERIDDMDSDLMGVIAQTHESGLKALLAPTRPEMAELVTLDHMKKLIGALRQQYDYVILDTQSTLNDVTLTILDLADKIILVSQQTLPSLKNASRFYELTTELDYDPHKIMLIVNAAVPQARISMKDIADALKRPVMASLPADDTTVREAADQGKPIVTGPWQKRPIAAALLKLADLVIDDEEDEEERVADSGLGLSRLARLFGGR
jgi:pilus assembly protein CpaE